MLNSKLIGNKILKARKNNNLSQAKLAQKIAISPQAVGKWERGESIPDIATLQRLSEIVGVDLNYFSDTSPTEEIKNIQDDRSTIQLDKLTEQNPSKKLDWNWDMSQGNWVDGDFSGIKNLKDKFSSSNMKNCMFLHSNLSQLILSRNNIEGCDFSKSNLRESKIQHSNIQGNQFTGSSFIDAEFYKSNVSNCDFSGGDFSGAEFLQSNLEKNSVTDVKWNFTKFYKSNISEMSFSGILENCHFEHCGFYGLTFENVTFINTFFKYNSRFKKVQFVNCKADNISYAFLKNNQANLTNITLV